MISMSAALLALKRGWDVTLLSRGGKPVPDGMDSIVVDIHDEEAVATALEGKYYNVAAQFIGSTAEDVVRDIRLFKGKTKQYIYVSSTSAHRKPVANHRITENTPLINPCWECSRNKIAAENVPLATGRRKGFPVTVVRPSHTYNGTKPSVCVHGVKGNWQILRRITGGRPVIVPGDSSSLWALIRSDDLARGYVGLMGSSYAIEYTYHITNDESMTWNQVYETIAEALGKPLSAFRMTSDFPVRHNKPRDLRGELLGDKSGGVVLDNTRIRQAVPDLVCTVPAAEGLKQSAVYMLNHSETQVKDSELDR